MLQFGETQEVKASPKIKIINRNQTLLHPINVEDLIEQDHPIRGIWEFIHTLDLSKYYEKIKSLQHVAGRNSTDPKVLLTMWIYSYSQGILSAREISKLCDYHPAYRWLTGLEKINHHTISDFRSTNAEALDDLFAQILGILDKEGLIDLNKVMHDGTKIKANASLDTYRRKDKLEEHLQKAKEYLEQINNPEGNKEISIKAQKARERAAKEKKEKLELALKELEKIQEKKSNQSEKDEVRVSMTDPEARKMKDGQGAYVSAFNVQLSTDSLNKIIVGHTTTQACVDSKELLPAIEKIEENLSKLPTTIIADGGYTSRSNIIGIHDKGVNFIASLCDTSKKGVNALKRREISEAFYSNKFKYDPINDSYMCPMNHTLKYQGKAVLIGITEYRYKADFQICKNCSSKSQCCPKNDKTGRVILRREEDPIIKTFNKKMKTDEVKNLYKERGPIAEFPNAWIKSKFKLRQFSLRGLSKTSIETTWACITYNIQQWLRLSWANKISLAQAI